jgi:8-oxo-dGTP diphosphatase
MMYTVPAYVGILLVKNNQILLVKRHNTDWAAGCWNFPGGLLEINESLVAAACRETREEVGVIVDPADFELVHVLDVKKSESNTKDILGFYFVSSKWQGQPLNNEPDRHSEIGWFGMDNLPDAITQHARHALDGFNTGLRYSQD